ncbi:MAG: hypothetical protein NC092_01225 [Butyrivibrio sp.]|nr:hypothetical protein [Muribaculum sp.]MCM1551294.1 hypothetical protein [Butyrivibrio sp.]
MEELYSIMRDFLEVEYRQESLLWILKTVEAVDGKEEQADIKLLANGTKHYLQGLHKELKAAIHRMDSYIAENVKK